MMTPVGAYCLLFDSCANMSLVGKGFRVVKYYPDSYVLSGYDEEAPTKTVPMQWRFLQMLMGTLN